MYSLNKLDKTLYFIYLLSAIVAFWYWHVDEHYQIIEFASYKLGHTPVENLAWEFQSQMRSAILPFIAFIISKFTRMTSCFHPYLVGAICRVLSALFFAYVYLRLIAHLQIKKTGISYKIAIFFWILPTVMVRFSPESIGGSLFILGFLIMEESKGVKSKLDYLLVGLLWGLAFYIRMHIAILIGVFIIYKLIYRTITFNTLAALFIGFLLSTSIEIVLSYWLYGMAVWSPYNYFFENVIQNKASHFGIMPWYYYFTETSKNLFYPIGILLWMGAGYFTVRFPKNILTWLFWSFILSHSLIGHKEYRFLFPIFPFFILMFVKSFETLTDSSWKKVLLKSFLILNLVLLPSCILIQSFKPLNWIKLYSLSNNYRIIYSNSPNPYALSPSFYHVRPYFWKHPSCQVIELRELDFLKDKDVSIYISSKYLGNQIRINNKMLTKSFQTIPESINKKLPVSITNTIDYLYVYQKL